MRLGWIPDEYNLADLSTKTKMRGNMRHEMVESIFYNKVVLIKDKDES